MLVIVRKARQEELEWHVGESKPMNVLFPVHSVFPGQFRDQERTEPFTDVATVHADGHELDYIRQHYTNLPDVPNKRIVTWRGELAQFIYDHLPK